ncbi:hypothetical protein BN7_641 [Wickerhamomyces ciferrii]|uniref:Uncharacterized protein n=1 Tax=Wickerhamomyces ciferrii (strain ATCC 14091 / BCRC 22168 / CBS 111 / JCM 3599 / NBRC 0793 / NRRL Y-1031 F-60-10) TaxID=1206466 RepID=K0KI75_WICCF|nr:uncharacterized protein BN7_641 [Wickerhamomyces ciferrii]CCH41104.1 hypothetical protein BN7_641 [Wickerhamomyces ciferrii]
MSVNERSALSVVSANTLNKKQEHIGFKPTLPNINSLISAKTFPSPTSPSTSSIGKPQHSTKYAKHAEKLKYRLQLAYYKLRTDQVKLPIAEIIKKEEAFAEKQEQKSQQSQPKIASVTPSLTRHISLLAASTPLPESSNPKKRVTFKRSATTLELPKTSTFKHTSSNKSAAALSRISEYQRPENLRSLSSPQLNKPNGIHAHIPHHRSLKIEDLVNNTNNNQVDVTPIKGRTDDSGDLIMSSPTKKMYSSTPGSYGAAKSLLQLSLISSN